jgi:hypothetical protein
VFVAFGAFLIAGCFLPLVTAGGESGGHIVNDSSGAPIVVLAVAAIGGGFAAAAGWAGGFTLATGAVLAFPVVSFVYGETVITALGLGEETFTDPGAGAFCLALAAVVGIVGLILGLGEASRSEGGNVPPVVNLLAAGGVVVYIAEMFWPAYSGAEVFLGDWRYDGPRVALAAALGVSALLMLLMRSSAAAGLLVGALLYPISSWVVVLVDRSVVGDGGRILASQAGLAAAFAAGVFGLAMNGRSAVAGRFESTQGSETSNPQLAGVLAGALGILLIVATQVSSEDGFSGSGDLSGYDSDLIDTSSSYDSGDTYDSSSSYSSLYDACDGGDMASCDSLYRNTPSGSAEERFGGTCGGYYSTMDNADECRYLDYGD